MEPIFGSIEHEDALEEALEVRKDYAAKKITSKQYRDNIKILLNCYQVAEHYRELLCFEVINEKEISVQIEINKLRALEEDDRSLGHHHELRGAAIELARELILDGDIEIKWTYYDTFCARSNGPVEAISFPLAPILAQNYSAKEVTAGIFHEIGHIYNRDSGNRSVFEAHKSEFLADLFVKKMGYARHSISYFERNAQEGSDSHPCSADRIKNLTDDIWFETNFGNKS